MCAFCDTAFGPCGAGAFTDVIGGGGGSSGPSTPFNTALPVIDIGDGKVGTEATATPGSWDNADTVVGQWQRDTGTWGDIAGATSTSYTLDTADAGYPLRYKEVATNGGGDTVVASEPDTALPLAAPTMSGAIVIDWQGGGDGHVGDVMEIVSNSLNVDVGNPPASYDADGWVRGLEGVVYGGSTHEVSLESDTNKVFYYTSSTYTNSQGSVAVSSNELNTLGTEPPFCSSPPTIAYVGAYALVTDVGEWSGNPRVEAPQYQWQASEFGNWSDVVGQTGSSILWSTGSGISLKCIVTRFAGVSSAASAESNVLD